MNKGSCESPEVWNNIPDSRQSSDPEIRSRAEEALAAHKQTWRDDYSVPVKSEASNKQELGGSVW